MLKKSVCIFSFLIFLLLLFSNISLCDKIVLSSPITNFYKESASTTDTVEKSETIDEIQLKQKEMRNTVVFVRTHQGSGSGTIIDSVETDVDDILEYRILTNAHVSCGRFITILQRVNSLTGKIKTKTIDTGCRITIFDYQSGKQSEHKAKIIEEDISYDFAMLSFRTSQVLDKATLASNKMLNQVRVFDNVFAIGFPFGQGPLPTTGIISKILTGDNGEKKWVIYNNTAQLAPGSSGGGLFKKYGDHYYLIGIPFRVQQTQEGQIISHMSRAISISTAMDFINRNMITTP